jgi:Domain of unknown function (DUF5060)/Putative collagen-binding domain of a collagenase
MKTWFRDNRALILVNSIAVLGLATGWGSYVFYGQGLVESMYKGESVAFLNSIIEGQSVHPLAHYLRDANNIMWRLSALVVAFSAIATVVLKMFPSSVSVLESVPSVLSRCAIYVLAPTFFVFSIAASALAFFYPLEIETRESTVWLHALALKAGVNIFDHSQVAFINTHHGPFDSLFKFSIATIFSFLESWQVTRVAVFLLPYVFLVVAWNLIRKSSQKSLLHVLYLGSIGYLFLVISAKEFLFVGRLDATAGLFFLLLVYAAISFLPKTDWKTVIHGFACGAMAAAVVLTSWRFMPSIVGVLMLTIWLYARGNHANARRIAIYLTSYVFAAAAMLMLILFYFFEFDFVRYYKLFFGMWSQASGWTDAKYGSPYDRSMGAWGSFFLHLLNPTAPPYALKGGPLLLTLAVYALVPDKVQSTNKAWLLLGCFSFIFCALAYYLNYWGGGQWYFIPFMIILWFFVCANYSRMTLSRLALLGICALVLVCLNARTILFPTFQRAITMERAREFMTMVRGLQGTNSIVSEDTFLFRTSYQGELIDMGDQISLVTKGGFYGQEFNRIAQRHFEQTLTHPPDYFVTGLTESLESRALMNEKYILIAKGPDNLSANGHGETRVFMRKDLIIAASPGQGLEQVPLYGVWEIRAANPQKYQNPFNFTEIELQATFTAPSGKRIKFFGFYDGDGNGGQVGNVWKLRFMPDELGIWNYSYTWTDRTPGGSGVFTVVDTGLPGPLKIATDKSWYFMTARGEPFHARPYGMQDYGPRIGSSPSWDKNSREYIGTLKGKVIARGYNMVMASGPNRFRDGRNYWSHNQNDTFDIAVWQEYEKVLRYALDTRIYFFPFDGMAEQSAFGMPVSRFTKYIGRFIPWFDRPVGRVTPVFKRYMVARYGAFASFMGYSPTWEWPEFWSESATNRFMSELRSWNPFPTLLTAHDSSRSTFVGWMGFSMRQANWVANDIFGGNCRACGHHGGVQPPFDNLPIMGSEEVWEAPVKNDDGYPQNAAEVRRAAWGAMMAGVMPVYSEWYWDFFMGNGKGEAEVRRMFDFFYSRTRYRQYQQLNQLVVKAARQIASGTPGQEYLVYDEDGGSITIDLSGVPSATPFSVLWFDPKTGTEQSGGRITGGLSKTLAAPFSGDTVLLLRRAPADTASR